MDGGTDGGGSGGESEEDKAPLMGWSCTAADAGLPMLLGLLALMLLARRRGSQPR
jgi:MYXO-CTERM domain-containing protein